MFGILARLKRDTNGATAVEYGLILALVFLAMLSGITAFGASATAMWTMVSNTMSSAA